MSPRHLTESESHIPLSAIVANYSAGVLGIPSGLDVPDVEAQLISDTLTTLDGRLIYMAVSGIIVLASGTNPDDRWAKLQFGL